VPDQNQFGQKPGGNPLTGPGTLRCDDWEAMLTDALDGQLSARDLAAFDAHAAACAGCADLLAHARQGQEWLVYLQGEPEVPAGLVSKILDKTAGAGAIPLPVIVGAEQGSVAVAAAIPLRRSFQETRLLMTVAMAFFSIALTLNMAGIKVTSLRLADLRPATIGNSLSRQFHQAGAQISKFYYNTRLMYQLESKMRELRRDTETQPAPQKKVEPSSRNGGEQGSGLRAQSSDEPGSWPGAAGSQKSAMSGQRSAVSTDHAPENPQPQAVHTGIQLRRSAAQAEENTTEVKNLTLQYNDEAGPRQMSAGCDGRSLA